MDPWLRTRSGLLREKKR